jgi:pilus assembly protein CpaB
MREGLSVISVFTVSAWARNTNYERKVRRTVVKRRAIIISAVSAIIGILLMQIYIHYLETEISGGPSISVLIAAKDILPGTVVDRSKLGIRELPQAYVEQRHIRASDVDVVLGATANTEIKANESLMWTDFSAMQRGRRSLSGLVREGMRAISIEARVKSFGGLIRPGDRVDVLFTANAQLDALKSQFTSTLLQNLLVLAVGNDTGGQENAAQNSAGQVTLSVTVEQGQLLTQAEHQGALKLILRNPNDIVLVQDLPQTTPTQVTGATQQSHWLRMSTVKEPGKEIEHVR